MSKSVYVLVPVRVQLSDDKGMVKGATDPTFAEMQSHLEGDGFFDTLEEAKEFLRKATVELEGR